MKEIKLTRNQVCIVDDEDFKWLSQYKWYADFVQSDNKFRARSRLNGTLKSAILMHRLILEAKKNELIDHKNMNPLDNRRCNLRKATKAKNMQNRNKQKNNTSGFKGVSWSKNAKKWRATIRSEGIWKFLGNFNTKQEAALAYNNAANSMHGEFSNVNS